MDLFGVRTISYLQGSPFLVDICVCGFIFFLVGSQYVFVLIGATILSWSVLSITHVGFVRSTYDLVLARVALVEMILECVGFFFSCRNASSRARGDEMVGSVGRGGGKGVIVGLVVSLTLAHKRSNATSTRLTSHKAHEEQRGTGDVALRSWNRQKACTGMSLVLKGKESSDHQEILSRQGFSLCCCCCCSNTPHASPGQLARRKNSERF